ncbi:MAG TPA: FCD domain-containing protein, partial [Pseudonocardia sp.]|nr:FCD domain-containing protein [Pseudonocardia sp.]
FTMMGQPVSDVLRTRLERTGVDRAEWDRVDAHHLEIAEHIARGDGDAAEHAMREHLTALRSLYERTGRWNVEPEAAEQD